MALTTLHPEARFKLRISTALVCVGLVFWPWATYLLPRPAFLEAGGYGASFFNFTAYHFSGSLFFFGFVMAFASLVWFAYRRQWRAAAQSFCEMVVCIGAAIFLPAY